MVGGDYVLGLRAEIGRTKRGLVRNQKKKLIIEYHMLDNINCNP